jgi:hypothetical protein
MQYTSNLIRAKKITDPDPRRQKSITVDPTNPNNPMPGSLDKKVGRRFPFLLNKR